jgi:LytS/YehU family sensor histidine kinase
MENNSFIIPITISIVYLFVKICEMRFIIKENRPIKDLFRDTIIVCLSSILGIYAVEQLDTSISSAKTTSVFVGNPDF